ncbi:MAG: pyruvate formate lyase family protein, partial [Desulfobacterales bacterium]|nr:pyruvate formate lyase family protein [Desulfobacterales bacterium]MDX2511696.1 pyruvate formate lyase family protein [Desulfobacterales bacterium]
MNVSLAEKTEHKIKQPQALSPRITWLRDYYFSGCKRNWTNEYTAWSTGPPGELQYQEMTDYIVPEVYMLIDTLGGGYHQAARNIELHDDFWTWHLPERKAWFLKEVMVNHVPREILPGDLIAGARFNVITSTCFTKKERHKYDQRVVGKKGARSRMKWFHDHGYGNAGATSGHLIPGYERALKLGWKGIHESLKTSYAQLDPSDQMGRKGSQFRAMITAATLPRDLAKQYTRLCTRLAAEESDPERSEELMQMAKNLESVPWEPARTFWEAVQSLWLTHMLVMSDENYPGPGVSFGRIDQYLLPNWEYSRDQGMGWEFAKEILKCFWFHCNTA